MGDSCSDTGAFGMAAQNPDSVKTEQTETGLSKSTDMDEPAGIHAAKDGGRIQLWFSTVSLNDPLIAYSR